MNEAIQQRYEEVIFIKLIQDILNMHANPGKVFEIVENICVLAGGSPIILSAVMRKILSGVRDYTSSEQEYAKVMTNSRVGVPEVCKFLNISRSTYYRHQKGGSEIPLVNKFPDEEFIEVHKFLVYLNDIATILSPMRKES